MATKKEIIEVLESKGIEFDESATKAELEALLPTEDSEEEQEEIQDDELNSEEEEVEEAPVEKSKVALRPDGNPAYTKAQFKELIEAYKVQNPVKYEMKKDALLKQLNAIK